MKTTRVHVSCLHVFVARVLVRALSAKVKQNVCSETVESPFPRTILVYSEKATKHAHAQSRTLNR